MKFSLSKKLIIFFYAFLIFFVAPIFGYSYFKYKNITDNATRDYLVSLAEAMEAQVFLFFEKNKIQTSDWSSDNYIRQEFEEIMRTGDTEKIAALRAYIISNKHSLSKTIRITDIFNLEGVALVSTDTQRVGHAELEEEMEQEYSFIKAKRSEKNVAFLTPPSSEEGEPGHVLGESMWHVSVPITSPRTGKIIGVMVNHISGEEIADILSGKWQVEHGAESGQEFSVRFASSDVYLVNKEKMMITPSRFIEKSVLQKRVDTRPVTECFNRGSEFAGVYENYRSTEVYGASMCITEVGVVLLVEVSEQEIFAALRKEQGKLFIFGGITLVVAGFISFFLSRSFLRNINIIHRVAVAVKGGDSSVRAGVVTSDETGELATVFNAMLDTLEENKQKIVIADKEIREKSRMLEEEVTHHQEQNKLLADSKKVALNLLEEVTTVKENLETEKYRLQTVLSSIGDGLVLIDGAYSIRIVNPRAVQMFNAPLSEIVGKDLRTVMKLLKKRKEEILPEHWPTEEMFLAGKVVTVGLEAEVSLTTAWRTTELPIALSVAPLGGGLAGGVIVIRDVSADRALDDAKSGFISVASHQLRTPLTTIRWYSEMLLSEDAGALSDAQRDFLNEIHGGAERLYQTIDLLLGISRVESGRLKEEKTPIDLVAFTNDIVHELAPSVTEKGLTISVNPPSIAISNVFLDQLMLRQVVMNLVSNAIRYTNNKGIIEIFWSKSGDDREVAYSVSDNGIGIPESQRGRIFTKFFRAENALVKVPDGSGLGLALVKELVESWKGRVWFETEEGKGTTFTFTVPLVTDVVQESV